MLVLVCASCASAPTEESLEPPPTRPARPEVVVAPPAAPAGPTLEDCEVAVRHYRDGDDFSVAEKVTVLGGAAACYEELGYIGHAIRVHKIVSQHDPSTSAQEEVARLLPLLAAPDGDAGVGYARCTEQLDAGSAADHVAAADCLYRKALIGAALAHRERAEALGGGDDPEANRAAIEHLRDRLARVEAMIAAP